LSNEKESTTEIQIDISLSEESKLKCATEMLDAMSAISVAQDDIKDYQGEKKEELEKWQGVVSDARKKSREPNASDDIKLSCATEIIEALNAISEIDDNLRSYLTEKKAEIAKCEW
jgi:hypothetical protein